MRPSALGEAPGGVVQWGLEARTAGKERGHQPTRRQGPGAPQGRRCVDDGGLHGSRPGGTGLAA